MIPRYSPPDMGALFTDAARFGRRPTRSQAASPS